MRPPSLRRRHEPADRPTSPGPEQRPSRRRSTRVGRLVLVTGTAVGVAATAAACGGGDDGSASPPPGRRVEVTARSFEFTPSTITARAGEQLAVALHATDAVHNFVVDKTSIKIQAGKGKTKVGGVKLAKPGTYTFFCSIPGHRSAGMKGTITVTP